MVRIAIAEFAVSSDGVIWRRVGQSWRSVDQVPDLPDRRIAASPQLVVSFAGHRVTYQPGSSASSMVFSIAPVPGAGERVFDGSAPRRLVTVDSVMAMLTLAGHVYRSSCATTAASATSRARLRCGNWVPLTATPEPVSDVALFPSGDVVGVGARGLVWNWHAGSAVREVVPVEVRDDSLLSAFVDREGVGWAMSSDHLIRRDSGAVWRLARRLARGTAIGDRFVVMPNGEVIVLGEWTRVWSPGLDSMPAATLHRPALGEPQVGAAHALADGRLVVGFAVPEEPRVGGWLQVWDTPVSANRSRRIDLPMTIDVTDLADDGRNLYIVGRGGTTAIALDSLAVMLRDTTRASVPLRSLQKK
jgi:hypothetical protein